MIGLFIYTVTRSKPPSSITAEALSSSQILVRWQEPVYPGLVGTGDLTYRVFYLPTVSSDGVYRSVGIFSFDFTWPQCCYYFNVSYILSKIKITASDWFRSDHVVWNIFWYIWKSHLMAEWLRLKLIFPGEIQLFSQLIPEIPKYDERCNN